MGFPVGHSSTQTILTSISLGKFVPRVAGLFFVRERGLAGEKKERRFLRTVVGRRIKYCLYVTAVCHTQRRHTGGAHWLMTTKQELGQPPTAAGSSNPTPPQCSDRRQGKTK